MKSLKNAAILATATLGIGLASSATADVFTYQGKLSDLGIEADGVYDFEFRMYTAAVAGGLVGSDSAPNVTVTDGLFNVDLDFGAGTFSGAVARWIEIDVRPDGAGPFETLAPRQQVNPAPRAHYAASAGSAATLPGVYGNAINFTNPGNQFTGNGSGLTKLNASALLTGNVNAARMATGGNWNLTSDLNIDGSTLFVDGSTQQVAIGTNAPNAGTEFQVGASGTFHSRVETYGWESYGSDGLLQTRLYGASWGQLELHGGTASNFLKVDLSTNSSGDSYLSLRNAAGVEKARMSGGGTLSLDQTDGSLGVFLDGDAGTDLGGTIDVYNAAGSSTASIDGGTTSGALMTMRNNAGLQTVNIDSDFAGYGYMTLEDSDSVAHLYLYGGTGGAAQITGTQNDGSTGFILDGDNGVDGGGRIYVADETSTPTVELIGGTDADGGRIILSEGGGLDTIVIDGDIGGESRIEFFSQTAAGNARALWMDIDSVDNGRIVIEEGNDGSSADMIQLEVESTGTSAGGQIQMFNDVGVSTIELDANWAGSGEGRILVDELQITGGSDLSEQFDIGAPEGVSVEPGMVVSIDVANFGELVVSGKAYDRTVAGIISGAGGVKPGMMMGQRGVEGVDGQLPVALTGRVYVWCDASQGAIQPGDLLTTSDLAGHAMKVTDYAQAQGAVIGKAMGKLDEGTGLVLVLVSLQ